MIANSIVADACHLADADTGVATPDFAQAVGAAGWRRLAPDIRQRFTEKPSLCRPIRYVGTMQRVDCSWFGLLLAQACRLLGTPFAPHRGTEVPVAITLRVRPGDAAIIWDRAYCYADHPTALVRSEKRMAPDGTLLECIGAGVTMKLAVFEAAGALHFKSTGYLWRIGRWTIGLPDLVSPGTAHVVHEDLGDGRFRFVMTIRHRFLGVLFHQDGVFEREGAAS